MVKNYDAEWEEQGAAPGNPAATNWKIYFKADGLYVLEDDGTEHGPIVPEVVATTSTDDTANPPTDGELDTAFGTPATVGTGFIGLLDDDGGDANVYLCATNGTSWWYVALTKAL